MYRFLSLSLSLWARSPQIMSTFLKARAYKANAELKMGCSDLSQLLIKLSLSMCVCVCLCDATTVCCIVSLYLWSWCLSGLLSSPFSSLCNTTVLMSPKVKKEPNPSSLIATVGIYRRRRPETTATPLNCWACKLKACFGYFSDGFKVVVLLQSVPFITLTVQK